eukprot:272139_1
MADASDDMAGTAAADQFREYVKKCGTLLLECDGEELEEFLKESASQSAVETYAKGEDSTFVLEIQSPIKSKSNDDEKKQAPAMGDTTFAVFSEIPPSAFDNPSSEFDKNYLLFMKINDVATLEDDKPMPSQIIISTFNPSQPFQSMIPYIRHSFVPIASLRAQREEKQTASSNSRGLLNQSQNRDRNKTSATKAILDKLRELELKLLESQDEATYNVVSLEPIPEISTWLEGLNDTDKQAIIDSHIKGKSIDIEIPPYLKEQKVLNTMLRKLRSWKDEITSVVRRNRGSSARTTVQQEIKFWKGKMAAIEQVETELRTEGVCASTLVLMKNNYVVQARAFLNQVQIKESKNEVSVHNEVLSTFPIKTLITASTVQDIIRAINEIFQHLDAFKLKNNYPVERIAILARAAARDVSNQLRDVLGKDIMSSSITYSKFQSRTAQTERLFHNFQNKYTKLRSDLRQRELLENRQRNFSGPWHRDQETDLNLLQKRVEAIKKIRKGHAEIKKVIDDTFASNTDQDTLQKEKEKIKDAFDVFRKVDVLKAPETKIQANEWEQCVQAYETKIQEVENEIQTMIRSEMQAATTPREMFRVCEKYNKLFVRDRIRNAVWEFQEELLKNVQEEIKHLQSRYRQRYNKIPASRLSLLRDIPAVSGEVIWCKQLKRQLDQNEKRLETVLGDEWKRRPNAKDLAEQMTSFAKKLDPMILVKQWENDAKSLPNFDDQAPIFKVDRSMNKSYSLNVAFDENYVQLFKEVRCLLSLGIRIDIALRLSCIDVKQKYPIAVKLKEAVSIFTRTCIEIDQYSSQRVGGSLGIESKSDDPDDEDTNNTMLSQLTTLVDQYKFQCQQQILDGAKNRWQNHEKQLNKYVSSLSKATISLQDKTQKAYDLSYDCDKILQELLICPLIRQNMTEKIEKLQKIVNKLDDGGFYGVPYWTSILNKKLERILLLRVDEILDGWVLTLDEDWDILKTRIKNETEDGGLDETDADNIFIRKEAIKHIIKINNNVLQVQPSISDAKMLLGQDLQSLLSMVVEQPRPKSDLARQLDDDEDERNNTFRSILDKINTDKIINCYRKIQEITRAAGDYAHTWLSYQALYDMDLNAVFEELGDDIGKWKRLLIDMKNSATSFDSNDVEKSFGPIVIHFGSVRNKVDEKYRNFRQQTFKALKARLGQLLRDFHNRATRGKHTLEETSFDTSSTKEIVSAITMLQELKSESSTWDDLWHECEAAEKLLVNNRYNLGATWMYASRVHGVLADFFQVLDMRWGALKQEATAIYSKLEERSDAVVDSVTKLEEKWHIEKPTEGWASTWTDEELVDWLKNYEGGALRPIIENFRSKGADGRLLYAISKMEGARLKSSLVRMLEISNEAHQNHLIGAMQTLLFTHSDVHTKLSQFDQSIKIIEEQYAEITTAKKAMSVVVDGVGMDDDHQIEIQLDNIKKEMEGLNEVHKALTVQWEKLQKIGKDQFMRLDTRELGKTLRAMEEELSHLPNKMKTYQVFGKFMEIIKLKKKMNKNVLGDLNAGGVDNPILRQKHWRELFQLLGIKKSNANALIVEDLWSINLLKYLDQIRSVCLVAQGENALENFLGELNDKWQQTFFELVDYKGKCSLVKNWNDLMADIADSLSDVMSMKQSPYFKSFERDSIQWEEKLNSASAIFDVMVDVQRRWVYLQGVFTNSEDVKRQLGGFYQKFKAFDREFLQLMKGIKGDPLVDHWVSPEQGLLQKLETNQNTLNQIQKALNEYLESQRALFARFYFIGDDDLLEIIGNSRDPIQMNRHLSKMFAGITQLQLSPDNEQVVVGMVSKEGESVPFRDHVDVAKSPKIQDWLTQVEHQMRVSLASLLEEAIETYPPPSQKDNYFAWCRKFPAQVALLAVQVNWSEAVQANLKLLSQDQSDEAHHSQVVLLEKIKATLTILADRVLMNVPAALRKLYEQLITEQVYQRDVTRNLIKDRICSEKDFKWLYRMRFYWNKSEKDVLKKLQICISRAKFYYGFEYFGATERLVQTPLTDKAYLTLCEALHAKLGGNPFGPAGTGKTESVKALGAQLGRFVLVFCCDENFDYAAMSRIFIGLCQCGAWGCFDEFNRLEEKILSAVSQQILTIQEGLKTDAPTILIRDQACKLDQNMGIFVTMNPGYAGRSELPDNLKQLFRGMAMIKPNRVLIAQVMLFSQGFTAAELLSSKIVLLFELCRDQLSKQSHYDFGLRALKSVLRSAGNLKRSEQKLKREEIRAQRGTTDDDSKDESKSDNIEVVMTPKEEETILIRSLMSTVVPKLVMNDKFLFDSLLDSAFPGADIQGFKEAELKAAIKEVAKENNLRVDEAWLVKLMQFHTIQNITHGVMLVGPSGAGKTSARNTLLAAMEKCDGIKSEQYEIDPKAIQKEQLYGVLDATTLEWTDGVFTSTLRTIIDNVRGEANKRHWIVFDGDVDPEWAENLNSVLDDNKMLTLPNGERLALTPNIRIIFETPTLYYATPATVSRCGMVWFSEECVTTQMLFDHMLLELQNTQINQAPNRPYADWEDVCGEMSDYIKPFFMDEGGLVIKVLQWAEKQFHVMKFTRAKAIFTLFSQLRGGCINILEYNENTEYPLNEDQMKSYYGKFLLASMLWAFGGPMKLELRFEFGKEIINIAGYMDTGIEMPDGEILIDYEVNIEEQTWVPWSNRVNNPELEPQKIKDPTVVINTIDTIRHEEVIRSWLADLKPVILCGPPGSGKSMTLSAVLRANPQYEMITLNFSSTAGTELIFKAFEQYCKIERRNQGYCIRPTFQNKTLVIFCDEINLPAQDLYGTQTIITFLRQLICKGGYWHPINKNWIMLENIQFVGACNPPTDAGRVVLSPRFLNHCPLILVDFPGRESLLEIYGTFIRALLKLTPSIRQMADNVTTAMVDVYQNSQKRFNTDIQAHYVYSPRELSRWTRAMYRALAYIEDVGGTTAEEIVRLWAHEALRLFSDRLVDVEERKWTADMIHEVAGNQFSQCDLKQALVEPILYSDYLSKNYVSVDKHALKDYILQRLKVFNEEELDVQLVIYDELLDHILRIDRVLRQPLGHLLMVGASGAGKTVFSRFVSWLNGMTTFQIKVHKDYSAEDFDMDLRGVLIQSGVEQQKMTFIFDESNILDTAFLERMNALLASGEVPGLFEDAEYMQLIMKLREAARKDGLIIDTEEELYQMFTTHVQNNLHIVFTMNPAGGDFSNRAATSPALFNRCVINWWGTWPQDALLQVAAEFTESCDLNIGVPPELRTEEKEYKEEDEGKDKEIYGVHLSVSQTIVQFHQMVEKVMEYLANQMVRSTFVTPRHYLDLIHHFVALFDEKRQQLEDQQKHLNTGLKALKETEEEVARRQVELDAQAKELNEQQKNAKETLEQMMVAEKDASKKRKDAIRVSGEVDEEMKRINKRTNDVESELAEAKPALEAAQKAVSNINKKQLNEIKSLKKPPQVVDMTMRAVGTLMGKKIKAWKDVQKMLGSNDFIPAILKFDTNKVKEKTRKKINKDFMSNPDFTFERVNKASKVAGPLVLWVKSQVKMADLLDYMASHAKQRDAQPEPQESIDPQQELALVIIDYESEFKIETDQKQQSTATAVSDRVFSKQKQDLIDRYIASKVARINKNESLVDILSDYAFPTLNDPILNRFQQQIIAFLQQNKITIDALSHMKRDDFVKDVAHHCGSTEGETMSLHRPLYRLYGTIAQYADYKDLKRKIEHKKGSCCPCQCNYRTLQSITVTNRMITSDKIVLTTAKTVDNETETATATKPTEEDMDRQIKLNEEPEEEHKMMEQHVDEGNAETFEISRHNRCIYQNSNKYSSAMEDDILCHLNDSDLDGLETADVIQLIEYEPLPFELTFKRQKTKCCTCCASKKKQKGAKKKAKHGATAIVLNWIIKFMKLSLNIVSKSSSMLDAVTDMILLYKSSRSEVIPFTMILFLTLLAPYILSYSSGVQIFLYRKTFENVELFTFKSLLLGLYLFPTGIIYFILLDVVDALAELYKWFAFGVLNKLKSQNDLVQIEANIAEYFGMSRMDWFSFKKQKLIAQLFFETAPQAILQVLLAFHVIEGRDLAGISDRDLILSIGAAILNSFVQLFRLKKESKAAQETFVQYSLHCITARFGWVPFNHLMQQFVDAEDRALDINYKMQYELPLITHLSKQLLQRNAVEPLYIAYDPYHDYNDFEDMVDGHKDDEQEYHGMLHKQTTKKKLKAAYGSIEYDFSAITVNKLITTIKALPLRKLESKQIRIKFGDALRLLNVRDIVSLMRACAEKRIDLLDIDQIDWSQSFE